MKMNFLFRLALIACTLTATLTSATAQPAAVATTNITKTSFAEVTSQLDPGGDCYLYLGTAQWLTRLSAKVDQLHQQFTSMPGLATNDLEDVNHTFDIISHLVVDSGIQEVSGFGLSSIEIAPGLHRTKFLLHHYPGQGQGFLWKLYGAENHPLSGLDLLPANTALATFGDADLPFVWSVVKAEVAKSGVPKADETLNQLPAEFEKSTKMNWDAFLNSLNGEFGLILTLDESNMVPIPLPTGAIQVPAPGLMLVVRVKDDTIFNAIADQLKTNAECISVETNGLRMRTMPIPLPLPVDLRPTAASSGGYLFISTSDSMVQDVLAVKSGVKPGLKSTPDFARLSQNIPTQGNQFFYMSPSFGRVIVQIQKQSMASSAHDASAAQAQWMQSLFHSDRDQFSYSVTQNTPQGWLTTGNSSQSGAALVLLPAIIAPSVLAAIAVPNFVKARSASQENACINNLRQIDAAKNQWALEKNKTATDVPTEDDLKPYLYNNAFPTCPQGGTYTIGALSEKPTCSVPGHALPAN